MTKRDFLTTGDVSAAEWQALIRQAAAYKRNRRLDRGRLSGKTVALVFQKPSMRTRAAFEVAVTHLGGSVMSLGKDEIQLGYREPVKDAARVLSRYVDAIVVRTFAHRDAEEFAAYSTVPVINGLSDLHHPCQALADWLTIQEHFGRLKGLQVAYVGDGNNVLHSLVEGACALGVSVRVATPKGYEPDAAIWRRASSRMPKGSSLSLGHDPAAAVRGADVVYTDVWVSMGQELERQKRLRAFAGFQVNDALLSRAKPGCRVLHCLPAHRDEEITNAVMEGRRSLVFDQAENRLHAHKAILALLLAKGKNR